MKIHTIQLNIGEVVGGTAHMDATEFGAYMSLLIASYQIKDHALPADDVRLARLAKCTMKVWLRVKDTVLSKFNIIGDKVVHDRVQKEIEKYRLISSKNKDKSLKYWETHKQTGFQQESIGKTTQNTVIEVNKELTSIAQKEKKREKGKRLRQWYEENNLTGLPENWRDYARKNHNWADARIESVGRLFWRYWNSPDANRPVKRDWDTAWKNWVDRDAQNNPAVSGRGKGYSLEAVHSQALADAYRPEGREERLRRLGIGIDTSDNG